MNEQLFAKNQQNFIRNFGQERYDKLDSQLIRQIHASSSLEKDQQLWSSRQDKAIALPDIIPRRQELYNHYQDSIQQYSIGSGISQYLNDIENDPHLYQMVLDFKDAIEVAGFDPSDNVTLSSPPDLLIVLDCGDGAALAQFISAIKPKHIFIYVDRWENFVSSFGSVDWIQIYEKYSSDDRIVLGSYSDPYEIVTALLKRGVYLMEHAYIWYSAAASSTTRETAEYLRSNKVSNIVSYTGFINDEYNMLYNSAKMLTSGPRLLHHSSIQIAKNIAVVGSGPSLDSSIEFLREIQNSHLIVCSASNYGTLMKNNIIPDFLCILERGQFLLDDYKSSINDESKKKTILVTSSVSDYKLAPLFDKRVVYFRSALTPVSIYGSGPQQILPYDGPQAVNAAFSFACLLKPNQIVFVGCDLGTLSLDKVRSDDAVGISPRNFDREVEANFGGSCYTDRYMQDAIIQLENVITHYREGLELKVFNVSNGSFIKGTNPISNEQYISSLSNVQSSPRDLIANWLSSCSFYDPVQCKSAWENSNPRYYIAKLINQIGITLKPMCDSGCLDEHMFKKICSILNLYQPEASQVAARLIRGFALKSILAIKRQNLIMLNKATPQQLISFNKRAGHSFLNLLSSIEMEFFDLCDLIDSSF